MANKPSNFFLAQVNQLFGDIKTWLAESKLSIEEQEVQINEELTGIYKAPKLVISSSQEELAEIKPYGAHIIEAKGRIDVMGFIGTENLGYFVNGGPHLSADKRLYKEINTDGWYWVANIAEPKAGAINKSLFLKLITQVSDYEF
ncbi:conserved hypothetical protein [Beggiatoa sp. PS]|nr:conserved hypothetical protein [Beggiatoa sp. PS]